MASSQIIAPTIIAVVAGKLAGAALPSAQPVQLAAHSGDGAADIFMTMKVSHGGSELFNSGTFNLAPYGIDDINLHEYSPGDSVELLNPGFFSVNGVVLSQPNSIDEPLTISTNLAVVNDSPVELDYDILFELPGEPSLDLDWATTSTWHLSAEAPGYYELGTFAGQALWAGMIDDSCVAEQFVDPSLIATSGSAVSLIADPAYGSHRDLDETIGLRLTFRLSAGAEAVIDGSFLVMAAPSACPADLTFDRMVDMDDVFAVLGMWGQSGVEADLNGDGTVDIGDVFGVLAEWGACP